MAVIGRNSKLHRNSMAAAGDRTLGLACRGMTDMAVAATGIAMGTMAAWGSRQDSRRLEVRGVAAATLGEGEWDTDEVEARNLGNPQTFVLSAMQTNALLGKKKREGRVCECIWYTNKTNLQKKKKTTKKTSLF